MQIVKSVRALGIAACGFAILVLPVVAAQRPLKIEFANDIVGAEPKSLVSVAGIWRIENAGGNKVLAVDGRQRKEGQSSAGIADKARALWRALRGVSRLYLGLLVLKIYRRAGRTGFQER